MTNHTKSPPILPRWPFFLADGLFLALSVTITFFADKPLVAWQVVALFICVSAAAFCGIFPFLKEYMLQSKLLEINELSSTVDQISRLEELGKYINSATNQWENVQEHSSETIKAANAVYEQMLQESEKFADLMKSADDKEKRQLKVEVDKLRRMERDWLELTVHVLDHVHGLYIASIKSGHNKYMNQVTQFRNACLDIARRVGLAPFMANASDSFDPNVHQQADPKAPLSPKATIEEVIVPGYTYQGRLLRKVTVTTASKKPSAASSQSKASASPRSKTSDQDMNPELF
jgi:molecular chaperone GrpE (heat shock protein)